jgi:type VI secretion system Hcp family effector
MALQGEILVTDSDNSTVPGEREDGSSLVHEFKFSVNKPSENTRNRQTGHRKVEIFWVVKYIDQLTPALLQALAENVEFKEVKVKLYRIGHEGEREVYFEYTLSGVYVVSVENWMPPVYNPETERIGNMEKVGFMAREFIVTDVSSAKEYTLQTYGIE